MFLSSQCAERGIGERDNLGCGRLEELESGLSQLDEVDAPVLARLTSDETEHFEVIENLGHVGTRREHASTDLDLPQRLIGPIQNPEHM